MAGSTWRLEGLNLGGGGRGGLALEVCVVGSAIVFCRDGELDDLNITKYMNTNINVCMIQLTT